MSWLSWFDLTFDLRGWLNYFLHFIFFQHRSLLFDCWALICRAQKQTYSSWVTSWSCFFKMKELNLIDFYFKITINNLEILKGTLHEYKQHRKFFDSRQMYIASQYWWAKILIYSNILYCRITQYIPWLLGPNINILIKHAGAVNLFPCQSDLPESLLNESFVVHFFLYIDSFYLSNPAKVSLQDNTQFFKYHTIVSVSWHNHKYCNHTLWVTHFVVRDVIMLTPKAEYGSFLCGPFFCSASH